jgi:Flp pilus assembly protein TadD
MAPWIAALVIVLACVAVYANALRNPFLFDDQRSIEENPSITRLSDLGRVLRPPQDSPMTGRPLTNLTFAVNLAIGGRQTFGFHVVNLAIHVLAALTLFGVLRRTFSRSGAIPFAAASPAPAPGAGEPDARRAELIALVCALLWALHPLVSEMINYLTQRTESLMGLFYLLSLYCAIRAHESRGSGRWEIGAGISALFAVAAKEMALTLPMVVLLWDRVFAFPTLRAAWSTRRRLYGLLALSWLLFALVGRTAGSGMGGMSTSPWTYLLNQAPMILQYLKLGVWPVHLIFDYGVAQPFTVADVWPSLVAVTALLGATGAALWRLPTVGYWGAWFFITLAPSSSLVPIPVEVGAERRMYLPLIAIVVLAVTGLHALTSRVLRSREAGRYVKVAVTALALAGLALATRTRNAEYQTGISIWQTVIDRRPHWRAHEHLSVYLRDAGRMDESIAQLRLAASESPTSRHALAAALVNGGDLEEGTRRLREFVRDRPDDPDAALARRELAAALTKAGDAPGALDVLRAAAAAHPADLRTQLALGEALEAARQPVGAAEAYRAALRIQPDNVIALSHLAEIFAASGNPEALGMMQRALELEPGSIGIRFRVTQLLLAVSRNDEAERQARLLVSRAPDAADAYNLLGVALASQGRLDEARAQFAEALRLDPSHAQARANWERAHR